MGVRVWSLDVSRLFGKRVVSLLVVLACAVILGMPTGAAGLEYGHSHITGTVTSDGTTPLFNVQVVAYRSDGMGGWAPASGAQSHSDGSYDVSGLLAGTYRLYFNPVQDEYPNKWYAEKRSLNTADEITIGPSESISGVDVSMEAGHISGRLTDGGGSGADGVTVSVYEAGDWEGNWNKVAQAVTTPDGTYDVAGLRTGTHRIMFETSADYLGIAYGGGDSVWHELAQGVSVTAGMTTTGIDGVVGDAGHLVGTVTNDYVTGIAGIRVDLYERDGAALYDRGTTYTATDGTYEFGGLSTGTYLARFSGGGYPTQYYNNKPDIGSATDVSVTAGSVVHANVKLEGGRIRGAVTAYGAGGVEGIDVRVYLYRDGGVWATWSALTGADGSYDIGGLQQLGAGETFRVAFLDVDGGYVGGHFDSEYYLNDEELALSDDVVVAPGETRSNIDATLEAGTLQGSVTSDGSTGIPGVVVYAYSAAGSCAAYGVTGPDGSYSFPGLATGMYRLHFWASEGVYRSEYSGNATELAGAETVSVSYAGVTTYDAELAQYGHITGRVTSDGTTGIAGITVSAWTPYPGGGWSTRQATTAPDGSYEIFGLEPGDYRVSFNEPYGSAYGHEWYMDAADRDSAQDIPVSMGEVVGSIDATLAQVGHVVGTVSDGAKGVEDVMVTAYRLDGSWAGGDYTDHNGAYTIHLPTGTYRLKLEDATSWNSGVYLTQWYVGARTEAAATQVAVTNGATLTADATIAEQARIRGTVRTPEGDPVGGISVAAWPSVGLPVDYDTTASDGSYELELLPSDTYKVNYSDQSGTYFSEWYDDVTHSGAAQTIVVGSGDIASGIDATLTTGGHITGTVTSDGTTPLESVVAYAYKLNQSGTWSYTGASDGTEADGSYDISRLQTGTYRVRFVDYSQGRATEWYDDAAGPGTATDVNVTAGSITPGIDAELGPAGSIEGTVTAQGGGPLGGSWVYAYVPNGSGGWDNVGQAATEADGAYLITGLRPGDYRIEFAEKSPYLGEYYDEASGPDAAADVTVVAEQTTGGISAELNLPSSVTGRVTSDGANGIGGICVRTEKPDGAGGWTLDSYAYTDTDGYYSIPEVSPGVYRVKFDNNAAYLGEYYDDVSDPDLATPVTVLRGQDTTGINATLAERGHIVGCVTDGAVGLPDVYVWVYQRNAYGNWEYCTWAMTDSDGGYDVSGLTPGVYRLQFEDGAGVYVTEWFDDQPSLADATDVTVTAGATVAAVDATLVAPARITGNVTGSGSALAYATVRAYVPDGSGGWTIARVTSTDEYGDYAFETLAAGPHKIEFVGRDGHLTEFFDDKLDVSSADTVTATSGATTAQINAALEKPGAISGSVTTGAGAGIEGVWVVAYSLDGEGNWQQEGWVQTDSHGGYEISGLLSGEYRVWFMGTATYLGEYYNDRAEFSLADTVTVMAGATTGSIDGKLDAASSISGTVTSDGADGIEGASVYAYAYDGNDGWDYAANASTDASGAYTLGGLAAGTYRVQFSPTGAYLPEWWDDAPTLWGADDIVIPSGESTAGVDAVMSAEGHITGRVTFDGTNGIEGIRVIARSGDLATGWSYVSDAYTQTDGSYAIGGLRTGAYCIEFVGDATHLGEHYDDQSSIESATPVMVVGGGTQTGIDATLSAAAAISGKVTSDGIAGVGDVWVVAYHDGAHAGFSTTQPDGTYAITGLDVGSYRVEFNAAATTYASEWYDDARRYSEADTVTVEAGQTVGDIDAVLAENGYISGKVTSDGVNGLESICVGLYGPDGAGGWAPAGACYTDEHGAYRTGGLAPGTYRLQFVDESGMRAPEFYDGKLDLASATDVIVVAGATTPDVDVEMGAAGRITGRVTTDGTTGVADTYAFTLSPDGEGGWVWGSPAVTGADGSYDIGGLATGTYRVMFFDASGLLGSRFYGATSSLAEASPVSVTQGIATSGIDCILQPAGIIAGSVRAGVSPVADIGVRAYVPDGLGGWFTVAQASTGADGCYELLGLGAGEYRLQYVDYSEVHPVVCYQGSSTIQAATPVTVAAGAVAAGIDVDYEALVANTPPVSVDDSAAVAEDATLTVAAVDGVLKNDSDAEGDLLSVELVDGPSHGTAQLAADGSFVYRPAADHHGSDHFTYRASDGQATSGVATVTIAISPVPDVPVAVDDSATVGEDSTLVVAQANGVLANDSDADEDPLQAAVYTGPSHGTLSLLSNGAYTYQPAPNFSGADYFTYRAFDGTAYSAPATVAIQVNEVGEAPSAVVLAASSSPTLAYGASYSLVGTLKTGSTPLASRQVRLETSTNGTAFTASTTVVTGADGTFVFVVKPSSKTWYRVSFAGDPHYLSSASSGLAVLVKHYVSTPKAPSTMYATKYATVYGYLKPGHLAGTKPVRIKCYKKNSAGVYKYHHTVYAKLSDYSTYSKYKASVKLPHRGKWRLRAYIPTDSGHAAAYSSGYDYVTVK